MFNIILFLLASLADAAIGFDGPCPEVKPVDNINLTAFTVSPWYEIATYPSVFENKGECSFNSFKNEDGIFTFKFVEVVNKSLHIYNGFLDYDPNTQLLNYMSYDFQEQEGTKVLSVFVLAIDYKSYFICFGCKYDELNKQRIEYVWIMSRYTNLTEDAKEAVDNYLKSSSVIDGTKLIWNNFDAESCKVED